MKTLTLLILLATLPQPLAHTNHHTVKWTGPSGIQVLFYSPNVMERTARNHMSPRFKRTGDYVPTLRLTPSEMNGCLVAVNWNSRHWVAQNVRLTIDFWDRGQGRWERHVCRAVDWQQRRHSTGSRQRFELDYDTARAVNAVPNNTVARLIGVSK